MSSMVTSGVTQRSRKILSVVIFLAVMIIGAWFSTKAARFVTQTFSGNVTNSSAITFWSLYSPTDHSQEGEAGIAIQSTNYPPKEAVSPPGDVAAAPDVTVFDLDVEITGVGVLEDGSKTFVQRETLKKSARGAVQFVVTNKGEADSSKWQFRAALPTNPAYVFESEMQKPLAAQKKRTFTVIFDKLSKDKNNLVIEIFTLESRIKAKETNKINNIAEISIVVE